jgi:hypothetical protein
MAQMIRKQVYIEPRQDADLKRLARTRGVTEAEIIRQAIDRVASSPATVAGQRDAEAWEEARAFIQALIAQGPVPGGRRWSRNELYEERLSRYGHKANS